MRARLMRLPLKRCIVATGSRESIMALAAFMTRRRRRQRNARFHFMTSPRHFAPTMPTFLTLRAASDARFD